MNKTIIIGNNTLLQCVKSLKDKGEISEQQYQESCKRVKALSQKQNKMFDENIGVLI